MIVLTADLDAEHAPGARPTKAWWAAAAPALNCSEYNIWMGAPFLCVYVFPG
jgi:hypothetical protein